MGNIVVGRKSYTGLIIADTSNDKVLEFVNTVVNNLLDRPRSDGWTKYMDLPPIQFSVVDVAENRDSALRKLNSSKYDVVIVNNRLDGEPIGSGTLKRFRELHKDALFIPLLNISQMRGQIKGNGEVSDGRSLENLYKYGFYSGMYKKNFNVAYMITMILRGGRTQEEAMKYYGLNLFAENSLTDNSREVPNEAQEKMNVTSHDNREEVQRTVANEYKLPEEHTAEEYSQIDAAARKESEKNESSEYDGFNSRTETNINNKFFDNMHDRQTNAKKVSESLNKDARALSGEKKNRKQRRAEDADVQARAAMHLSPGNNENTEKTEKVQPLSDNMKESDEKYKEPEIAKEPGDVGSRREEQSANFTWFDKSQDETMEEIQRKKEEQSKKIKEMEEEVDKRGSINRNLVTSGMLTGRVMFAKEKTVWVELTHDISELGLGIQDLYEMPVAIPFAKFGTNQLPGV